MKQKYKNVSFSLSINLPQRQTSIVDFEMRDEGREENGATMKNDTLIFLSASILGITHHLFFIN